MHVLEHYLYQLALVQKSSGHLDSPTVNQGAATLMEAGRHTWSGAPPDDVIQSIRCVPVPPTIPIRWPSPRLMPRTPNAHHRTFGQAGLTATHARFPPSG